MMAIRSLAAATALPAGSNATHGTSPARRRGVLVALLVLGQPLAATARWRRLRLPGIARTCLRVDIPESDYAKLATLGAVVSNIEARRARP